LDANENGCKLSYFQIGGCCFSDTCYIILKPSYTKRRKLVTKEFSPKLVSKKWDALNNGQPNSINSWNKKVRFEKTGEKYPQLLIL